MIVVLLAAAIGQVDDVGDLRERWEVAELILNNELASFSKSYREQYHAIQREPVAKRKRVLSDELEAYKNEVSPLLFGIRRAVDRMRLKHFRANGGFAARDDRHEIGAIHPGNDISAYFWTHIFSPWTQASPSMVETSFGHFRPCGIPW